ncbi:hypothetical protein GS493_04080 [Rhodococcus hoagii]|nr:hypothetical protein [Prescottella equi]NKS62115.1 hypothetical protein [Prescottella equi]
MLARLIVMVCVAATVFMVGGGTALAQDQSAAQPQTVEELSPEEKSWRDNQGVISCDEHPDFSLCAALENSAGRAFKFPNDNTAYTAIRNAGDADDAVNTEIDIMGAPGRAMDKAVDSAFGKAAESIGRFAGDLLVESMVWWIKTDSIDISYANVLAGKTPVQQLVGFVMMAGILSGAIMMMVSRRTQPAADILMGGVKYILISALAMVVLKGAISAGDDFARQMVEDGANEFGQRVSAMLGTAVLGSPGGVLLLGIIAALLSFIQWVMGFIRQAGIVVLYALILIAAAGQLTTWGRQWFPRIAGACVALVLFKPIAAMIYSIGFKLIGTEQSLTTLVTGIMVVALAVLALPAMMKFFSFVGMQVGGGIGAGAVLAGGIAAGVGGGMAAGKMFGGSGGGGDDQSSFMASTGPDGNAESDPSPGNTGGSTQELSAGNGGVGSGASEAPQPGGSGPDEADLSAGPSTAESPDAAGDSGAAVPGSAGPDLGGAASAGGGAAGAGAAAATGGASLGIAAGAKAVDAVSDAADSAASEMAPDDSGPNME